MTIPSSRVLVLGHNAVRQGAQIMLLDVLTWMRAHTDFELDVVLHHDGPLKEHYREVVPTLVANPFHGSSSTAARILRRLVSPDQLDRLLIHRLRRRLQRCPPDVVWANSVASWKLLDLLTSKSVVRILHVHELEDAIQLVGPEASVLSDFADHFIAVSEAVKKNLTSNHGISVGDITVIHECVQSTVAREVCLDATSTNAPLVIVGCGVASLRKGFDLLPGLVSRLEKSTAMPPFEFLWIGSVPDDERRALEHGLATFGIENRVRLVGEVADPIEIFTRADIFVLTSREDPFPLVCLEAAGCGLPVVCFADSGGAPELVEDDAGFVVPFLDLDAMSTAVSYLASDQEVRMRKGACAREKVEKRYTVEVQAPKIAHLIQSCIDRRQ